MSDPRSPRAPGRALAVVGAIVAGAVVTRSLVTLLAVAIAGVIALGVARVPPGRVVGRIRATALVVGGALLVRAFASPAHARRETLLIAARVIAAAVWSTWLVATETPLQLEDGLRTLGAPRALVALLALTRRFGAQLRATMRSSWSAAALRAGFHTPRTTAASVGTVAGVVLVRAFDRADRAQRALALRGGDGALVRGSARLSFTSWVALGAVLGAFILADRAWGGP